MWIQICNCLSTIPGLCDRTQLTLVDKTPRTHIRECLFVHALRLLVSLLFFILFSRSKISITHSVRITTFTITDLTEILSAVYCAIQHPYWVKDDKREVGHILLCIGSLQNTTLFPSHINIQRRIRYSPDAYDPLSTIFS